MGRDNVDIQSVRLSPDKKTVFLEVPGLQPVMQIRIKMNINAADGSPLPKDVGATINVVAPDAHPGITYTSLR